MERARRRWLPWIAFGMSIGAGLLLVEVATRLFLPYSTPETIREYSLDYEGSAFGRYRFAPVGRMVSVDPEKAWGIKAPDEPSEREFFINDLGFRGPPFTPGKPTGVRRVFVMGGSSVFDQNVPDRSETEGGSWPDRAEALLAQRGHDQVEVVNGGVPGHTSFDVISRLYSEIWLYSPDWVVLYLGWNDLKNFHAAEISPESPPIRVMRPFDDRSDPFRGYVNPLDRLLSRSQVYMKLRNRYFASSLDVGSEGVRPEGEVSPEYGPYGPGQYRLNVRTFVDLVRNMGAEPIVATQATLVSRDNDEADRARIGYDYLLLDHEAVVAAFDDLHGIVRDVATEDSVVLLDAAAAMNGRPEYFTDHVHLTPEGSEALAQLLADLLASELGDPSGS